MTRITIDEFLDNGNVSDVTVLATMVDEAGRPWAIVEERRISLIRTDGAAAAEGRAYWLSLDAAEALT